MAYIDNIYIHVTDESMTEDMDVSTHPTEKGIPTTDTAKRQPTTLSISGEIVNYELAGIEIQASYVLSLIKTLKNKGRRVTYKGRNICYDYQITSFSTSHPNSVWGGCAFSMTLQECRIAQNSYVAPKKTESTVKDSGQQQVEKGENEEVYYTTKNGDTIWGLIWTKPDGKTKADYRNLKREGADPNSFEQNRDWIMKKNPHAFSVPMNDRTMQNGVKMLMGTR